MVNYSQNAIAPTQHDKASSVISPRSGDYNMITVVLHLNYVQFVELLKILQTATYTKCRDIRRNRPADSDVLLPLQHPYFQTQPKARNPQVDMGRAASIPTPLPLRDRSRYQ